MRIRRAATAIAVVALAALCVGTLTAAIGAPPPIRLDAPSPVEATDGTGADVTYNVRAFADTTPIEVTCTPPGTTNSGDFSVTTHLALGDTTITCTATDSTYGSKSATVTVQDTTPPSFGALANVIASTTAPAGTVVNYTTPSATDAVDGTVSGTCSPASGSNFPVGDTTVNCSATDAHGNTGTASFTVTVTFSDSTPPTFTSTPTDKVAEATSGSGAAVTYDTPTASDNSGSVSVSCSPPSGSTFALGDTTVTCTASDPSANQTTTSFKVTVQDTTKPSLSLPADMTVSSGASVTYSATASDLVDGSVSVSCSPVSGSSFPLGTTTVTCSATDSHNNRADGSFHVTVQDQTPPVLSNVPANLTREANGPSGSIVTYSTPTATDDVDGPIASVTCAPPSGSTFGLGTTTVTCTATDSSGNSGSASFTVSVVDTTPPNVIPPGDRSVYATTDTGISANEDGAAAFVGGASASDVVDPSPTVTNDAPGFFGVGTTVVTFTARDASGNTRSATATLTVLPKPAEGTTPPPLPPPTDREPPDDVTNLTAVAGDGVVTLTWTEPKTPDFSQVEITRSTSDSSAGDVIYHGSAAKFVDRGVQNGLEYRYVVVAIDKSGNRSTGVAVSARPKRLMLRSPRDGAVVRKPPKLVWLAVDDAAYYNVQLFRGNAKILSAWPSKPTLLLRTTWKYNRRTYKLTAGAYRWYVWPGFGPRADANYGEVLGQSSFTVRR